MILQSEAALGQNASEGVENQGTTSTSILKGSHSSSGSQISKEVRIIKMILLLLLLSSLILLFEIFSVESQALSYMNLIYKTALYWFKNAFAQFFPFVFITSSKGESILGSYAGAFANDIDCFFKVSILLLVGACWGRAHLFYYLTLFPFCHVSVFNYSIAITLTV